MKKVLVLVLLICSQKLFSQTKIPSSEVKNHVNDSVTVCDKVYGAKYLDRLSLTLLDLGGEFPYHLLTVAIKGADRDKFKLKPELAFKGKKICVTGRITLYSGKPQIIVTDPQQIRFE